MSDTLFEKIVAREIPADIVYEDDDLLAFRDIEPQAPVHVLIIPKKRIATLNDLERGHAELVGRMVLVAAKIAKEEGIADDGYRMLSNHGDNARQEVPHFHIHLFGGQELGRGGAHSA